MHIAFDDRVAPTESVPDYIRWPHELNLSKAPGLKLTKVPQLHALWSYHKKQKEKVSRLTALQHAASADTPLEDSEPGHFDVGTKVVHPQRGPGIIAEVFFNDARNKPYAVQFDSGECQHYSEESAAKLADAAVLFEDAKAGTPTDTTEMLCPDSFEMDAYSAGQTPPTSPCMLHVCCTCCNIHAAYIYCMRVAWVLYVTRGRDGCLFSCAHIVDPNFAAIGAAEDNAPPAVAGAQKAGRTGWRQGRQGQCQLQLHCSMGLWATGIWHIAWPIAHRRGDADNFDW